ncbi:uncharacterized protein LOC121368465 [Gigantopelta aegis]|uniref:uncharacterized protein LOC121368465 n=1 Tax=Gigantopelta aegis TaxID=1735272 RepID=UPI001B88BEAB|nr:uncharacterized protein LOC121368465 [Gigantopelta aegis]
MSASGGKETGAEATSQVPPNQEELVNKERLRKCYEFVRDNIEPKDLIDYMFQTGALTVDDMDEIENTQPPTRLTRAKVLLRMVLKGKQGISMYDVLFEVLEKDYLHVREKLAATYVNERLVNWNWNVHLNAIRTMISWCFAYDKINYATNFALNFPETNPSKNETWKMSLFSVQMSNNNHFGWIPVNQTIKILRLLETQLQNGDNGTDEGDDEEELTLQVSKRKEKKLVSNFGSKALHKIDEQSIADDEFVEKLLEQEEGNDMLFYPDDKEYKRNCRKFVKDVVSMWNTPNRTNSFIVLGLESSTQMPHRVIGLTVSSDNDYYQSLILLEYFTSRPRYHYTQYVYNKQLVGVITVPSSSGTGSPSVVQAEACEPDLIKGQLWARRNTENMVIPQQDNLTVEIYAWFSPNRTTTASTEVSDYTTKTRPKTGPSSHPSEDIPKNMTRFISEVDNFRKGHFVLVSGKIPKMSRQLEKLALVPWIAVYDFDKYSRDSGLLSSLEDVLKKNRYLEVCTWRTATINLSEKATQWCFLRGQREIAESDTQDNAAEWIRQIKPDLDMLLRNLKEFVEYSTILKVVIFWPTDKTNLQCIIKFLDRLNDKLETPPKLIIVLFEEPDVKSKVQLEVLLEDFKDAVKLYMIQDELCYAVASMLENRQIKRPVKYTLPIEENHKDFFIGDTDAVWLRVNLDVLYLSNPYNESATDIEILNKEADSFFHGETISWFVWYAFGPGHLEVKRDIMKNIVDHINQKCQKEYRSSIVTLFHAPGGGGTTLAQRILWDLHEKLPCAEVKKTATIEGLAEKITFLYNKTHLPVLVLVDGEDESKVKQLVMILKSVFAIFLYVKRYPYDIKEPTCSQKQNKFYLMGNVSGNEANRLAQRFGGQCRDNIEKKKKCLEAMSREVCMEGKSHYVFEFGMTAYDAEFKGIASYVRGYLNLEKNPTSNLFPWQKALQYLSLVYYYGQLPMPLQFFASLLDLPSNCVVDIEDFGYPFGLFVVEDSSYGRTSYVRICHYLIAKEILEYTLNQSSTCHQADGLSKAAKRGLKDLCLEFIDYASHKQSKSSSTVETIRHILTQTFIFRDNKDVGENETQSRKTSFSQIVIDVDSEVPYTSRLEVMKQLTNSFPTDPNFLAHLGRFYAHCRPDEDEKAEACFKHSLELCEQETRGNNMKHIGDSMISTLMHIYHMYGMIYLRKVSRVTKLGREIPEEQLLNTAEKMTLDAENACEYFRLSRQQKPQRYDGTFNYGYTSEISVRLFVCDFVQKNWGGISNFLSKHSDHLSARFIQDTLCAVEDLIIECYSVVDLENINTELKKALLWYHSVFKNDTTKLEKMFEYDDTSSRRLKIATLKLKYYSKCASGNSVFEKNIISFNDVKELIDMYEVNFKDSLRSGVPNKRQLDGDYKEWLFAIRNVKFQKNYSVEKVLQHVRIWDDMVKSPSSKFYLFICKSLIGFGTKSKKGNSESLVEAQILKDDLQKFVRSVWRPRYPREWLGKNDNGIKCLTSNNRISYLENHRLKPDSYELLAVSKGTICKPNTSRLGGFIYLDLGNNSIPVKVFFIPLRAELVGQQYSDERVQFYLAFSFDHGYEAFEVSLLKKYPCSKCGLKSEIPRNKVWVLCRCGNHVERTELDTSEESVIF